MLDAHRLHHKRANARFDAERLGGRERPCLQLAKRLNLIESQANMGVKCQWGVTE